MRFPALAVLLALAGCTAGMHPSAEAPKAPKNYLVFFHFDSAELTPDARQVVDQAAAGAKAWKPSTIAIAGFTDKVGSAARNQRLSERRIEAVEQVLAADGVDPKLFLREPLGEAEANVGATGDRRVEIRLQTGAQ